MKGIKLAFSCLFPLTLFGQSPGLEISLHGVLRSLFDISQLPSFGADAREEEQTTYDRLGGNNDGFSGTWSYVRRNPDSSLVMLDIDGPGVINRITTPTPTTDTLDFYIDNLNSPALSVCYRDLFSGSKYPFVGPLCGNAVGGYYCYFPILFQSHCRIVCRGKKLQFYQIGYRHYPDGTVVRPFSGHLSSTEKGDLLHIADLWQNRNKMLKGKDLSKVISIGPGQTQVIGEWNKGGRINGIELDTAGSQDCRLRIFWDGEDRPAIDCFVARLFGYVLEKPAMQSLLVGSSGGKNYLYFPMPFDHHARIELMNAGTTMTYKIKTTIWYTKRARHSGTEGYFCVKAQTLHLGESDPYDILLNVTGKGQYVGTILCGQGDPGVDGTPFWEGDDSTVVDDSVLLHGTGTEDYFNGGWYNVKGRWDHVFSMPLSGCLGYSAEESWTGGYRLLISDKISFQKSLYQGFEHGGTVAGAPAMYSSVVFYYLDRPFP